MNVVILIGRLTKDPEIRYSQGAPQTCISRFSIAVNRRFKREGDSEADFFDCTAFGKTAEFMEKYLHKGTKILLQGRIENNNYVNRDGQKVYGIRIVAENIEFAEGKSENETKMSNTSSAPLSAPASARKYSLDDSGFMNIPEGIEEGLPFV